MKKVFDWVVLVGLMGLLVAFVALIHVLACLPAAFAFWLFFGG